MANNSRLRKALKKVAQPQSGWLDVFPAVIGKEDGTVLTGVAGEIYVRNVLNGQTLTVHNTVAPAIATLQVEVGRRVEQPGLWQIKGVRESFSTPAGGSKVAYHREQHIFPAPDAPILPRKQIRELTVLVTDGPNFIVQVFGGDVRGSTAYFLVDSQTVDLSSYVPATGAIYVNIETDESGVLSINTGADFLTPALGTAADIPVPATGKRRIATILLYETMTELLDSHILVPMVLESEAGGGGSGMEPGYLPWKHYARVATAAGLPAHTYDNTAGTITATSTGTLTVDGVLVALDDYILVKNDTTKNGLYKCTTAGAVGVAFVLTRAEDMNEASEFPGATIKVGPEGTGFGNSLIYECTNASVILGTTSITFDTIQARPIGAAGGDLTGLYPSPTVLNSAVIGKILTGFSAGAGTVSATDTILQAINKIVGNIVLKLTANVAITGATKTKITYDANGLVTAGADATTADISDSTNKRYVTDAQLTVIGNTSGTNSGNETATTIGALIGGAGDATPNDSDFVATSLTAGGILKKITWTNVKAFLKTYWDTLYAPIAKGVTNGDSHDHNGGDGAQIAHGNLSSIGTNSHAAIDTHLASTSNPHSTSDANLSTSDITTNDSSTSKHGFLKKLSNVATEFMNGAGNWVNPKTPLLLSTHGNSATIPASTTNYIPPNTPIALSTITNNTLITVAGTLKNFYVRTTSTQPASGTLVCTVMVNNVASAVTFTIAAGSVPASYSDLTHTVSIAAGDLISFRLVNNATGASAGIGACAAQLDVSSV